MFVNDNSDNNNGIKTFNDSENSRLSRLSQNLVATLKHWNRGQMSSLLFLNFSSLINEF